MESLKGKIALVTGSAKGIGKAVAVALAKQGANLVLADMDANTLKTTGEAIRAMGVQVETVQSDVTSEQQIENMFAKVMERFHRLDILVNNAGVFDGQPIEKMTTEHWDRVIGTDLRAPFLCTRAAFRIMKEQGGGRIINMSSISAFRGRIYNSAYNSAKSGLVGLTQSTSLEGREFGIIASCIHPGEVLHEGRPVETQKEPAMTREDVADAVVFMVSQSKNVNILELVTLPYNQKYLARG